MMGWQWHQLDHMQIICTSLQTTMPVPHYSVFTGRMPFLPPSQQHQSSETELINCNLSVLLLSLCSIMFLLINLHWYFYQHNACIVSVCGLCYCLLLCLLTAVYTSCVWISWCHPVSVGWQGL